MGVQVTPRSVRACHMQVYKDMKSELAIMTKPKDPNVLVVYGVYAIRPAVRGGKETHRLFALVPSLQGGDAVGAAARHRSVGSLGTQSPRRSEAPNQGRVICPAVPHRPCISCRQEPLFGRFRRHCLFCVRLRTDSESCMATRCACPDQISASMGLIRLFVWPPQGLK